MSIYLVAAGGSDPTIAAQSKTDTLATLALQVIMRVDELRAMSAPSTTDLMFYKGSRITFARDPDGSSFSELGIIGPGADPQIYAGRFDFAAMPANGNDVTMYVEIVSGASDANMGIWDSAGTAIKATSPARLVSGTTPFGTLSGQTGYTELRYGAFKRLTIFNAARTGSARYATTATGDSDVVALNPFAEGTGTTSADSVGGGNSVTVNAGTWVNTASTFFRPYFITG